MRRRLRLFVVLSLAAVGVAAATLLSGGRPARVARAADVWTVQVGGDRDAGTISVNSFLPSTLSVHLGDVVDFHFTAVTPHSVWLPAGEPTPPLIGPGPGAGELALGPAFFPIPAGPERTDVTFDGRTSFNAGVPAGGEESSFRVTFAVAGVFPYLCPIHPGMNGVVEVLAAGAPLPETPAQASARGAAQEAALLTQVRADIETVRSAPGMAPGATAVHSAAVGIASLVGPGTAGGASALLFLPRTLTVRRGDLVVWVNADPLEVHTVTFTSGAAPPPFFEVRPGPAGAMGPPLLVIPADVAGPAGGPVYTGQGYANSGLVTPGNGWALTIDAPAGSYEYVCLIHVGPDGTGMRGTVIVTE